MDLKWIMLSWYLGPNYTGGFQDTHIENLLTERNKTEMKLRLQEYLETGSDLLSSDFEDLRLFSSTSNSSANASDRSANTNKNISPSAHNNSPKTGLSLDHKLAHLKLQKKDIVLSASVQFTCISQDSICFLDPSGTRNKVVLAEVPKRDVAVMNSRPLLDTLYAIGGFGIPLRYADTAKDSESLVNALNLLFHLLKNDVRSLQEFESQSGYDILATLLKTKKTSIDLSVLDCILDFVGYDHCSPASSVLKNPLAYRSLITDFNVWKPSDSDILPQSLNKNSKDTFKFLVFQFTVFGQDSKYHAYNLQQLGKMKIISRFIQALKYQLFDDDMLPILHDSMLILINCNPTADSIRAISLYIVYALTQANNNTADSQSKCNANRQFTCGLK
ncbi:unnamed protein product [Ambrosiozyma monospora]|uniref:Unnamed protein product n=1 Tax=Ambrosiozyma monospora TaxID=43982 RepID=A0A9W7DJP5_AMBMO|nr:unnamed protein product [Ambrosiozyma monospora]